MQDCSRNMVNIRLAHYLIGVKRLMQYWNNLSWIKSTERLFHLVYENAYLRWHKKPVNSDVFLQCGVILTQPGPEQSCNLGQHRLFWNTEWQYLLWRKVNAPHGHKFTGSIPFCKKKKKVINHSRGGYAMWWNENQYIPYFLWWIMFILPQELPVCWICTELCRKDEVWIIDSSIVVHNIYVSSHNIQVHSCLTALSLCRTWLIWTIVNDCMC